MPENCQRAFVGTKPILSPDLIQEGICSGGSRQKPPRKNPVKKERHSKRLLVQKSNSRISGGIVKSLDLQANIVVTEKGLLGFAAV
jgi:hypothetical protein